MLCTGKTTNALIGLEEAVNAVLAMGFEGSDENEETVCGSPGTTLSDTTIRVESGENEIEVERVPDDAPEEAEVCEGCRRRGCLRSERG